MKLCSAVVIHDSSPQYDLREIVREALKASSANLTSAHYSVGSLQHIATDELV